MLYKNKIACISDIHLGIHQDSELWHTQHTKYAEWLCDTLKSNGIGTIIIAGDVFHNRHEVGVSTLHTAKVFFDTLKDFQIYAITGNHDCFYRDNSRVNSISIFDRSNITVYDTPTNITINNKKFAFCPWGTELKDIPNSDVIVGHFELLNFKMNGNIHCDHGWESVSLTDKAPITITGHFHMRQERIYDNGKVVLYLGSPLELEWGERDSIKGITILDTDKMTLSFIENDFSPKHYKLAISDLQNGKIKLANLKNIFRDNNIKLIVDVKFADAGVDTLIAKLNSYQPQQMRVEYELPEDDVKVDNAVEKSTSVTIENIMKDYIDALQETDIPKSEVYAKCIEYYKQFQTQ